MGRKVFCLTIAEALERYEREFLAARNLAPRTRGEYLRDLTIFAQFLHEAFGSASTGDVSRNHLNAYLAHLDNLHLAGTTRRRKVSSLSSLFGFLKSAGYLTQDPTEQLIPPEREQHRPRVLTEAEYKRLQLACAHETRDGAIIELILQTGLRLSEVSRLRVGDVNLPVKISKDEGGTGAVHVQGKGRKERAVTVNWKAARAIKSYLAVRPDGEDDHLFLTKFRRGIGPRAIENVANKYLDDASIHDASVHTLRHTFATHMVRRGTKLDVVRQALGHTDLKTTSIYVDLALSANME